MSDADLRECEHALAESPDDLGLLRQHARLLRRHGQLDAALGSIDLAWRLGAEDLHDELQAELEARSFDFLQLRFRYVPAGPFVMGEAGFDKDTSPPHLVRLSAYYVSEVPIHRLALRQSQLISTYWRQLLEKDPENAYGRAPLRGDRDWTEHVLGFVARHPERASLPAGRLGLPSEAQWERAFRACLLRPDGTSIYGVQRSDTVEWVADAYSSDAYATSSEFDPRGPKEGEQYVVRGVPAIGDAQYPLYRDAAEPNGTFRVGRGGRQVLHESGISFRLVFQPV